MPLYFFPYKYLGQIIYVFEVLDILETMTELNTNSKVVLRPNNNDVLCGRGSRSYCHSGNIQFRKIVSNHKHRYNTSDNKLKPFIAEGIVNLLKRSSPPGRYLSEDKERRIWYEISHNTAVQKTQQALREKTKWTKNDSQTKKVDGKEKRFLGQIFESTPQRIVPMNAIRSLRIEETQRDDKMNSRVQPSLLTQAISDQSFLLNATQHLNGSLAAPVRVSIEDKLNKFAATEEIQLTQNSAVESSFEMKSNILRKEIYLLDAFKNRIIADAQSPIPPHAPKPKPPGRKDFDSRSSNIKNHCLIDYLSQPSRPPTIPGKLIDETVNGSIFTKPKEFNAHFGCSKFMYQILLESLTAGRTV